FEWPRDYVPVDHIGYDPFAVAALTLATVAGESMLVEGTISNELYLNLVEAVGVYHWYFPNLSQQIEVIAGVESCGRSATSRVGTFFSGGVDSIFNIADLKRLHKLTGSKTVTDLWLVHGMDIKLDDLELWDKVRARLIDSSRSVDARFAPVRTNA